MEDPTSPAQAPLNPQKSSLGIARAIGLLAVSLGVTIVLVIAKKLLGISLEFHLDSLLDDIVSYAVIIWMAWRWVGTSFKASRPWRLFPVRLVPTIILASFGLAIVLGEVASWIPTLDFIHKFLKQLVGGNPFLVIFIVAVETPILEEFFNRGLLLGAFLTRYSIKKAVWASALIFAFGHGNPPQIIMALPVGLGFAWMRLRTGSILPGMLSHAVLNFSSVFLIVYLAKAMGYTSEQLQTMNHTPLSILTVGVVAGAVGCFVLWRQLENKRTPLAC